MDCSQSLEELVARVPSLNRKELTLLARIGALNSLEGVDHRRDALWQVERAGKLEGPLLASGVRFSARILYAMPLQQMTTKSVWSPITPEPGLPLASIPWRIADKNCGDRGCSPLKS